jgi:hypothetical protein
MSRQPAVEIRFSLTRNRRGRCPLAASDPPLFGLAALMALMAQQGIHRARVPFWAATDQYFLTEQTVFKTNNGSCCHAGNGTHTLCYEWLQD